MKTKNSPLAELSTFQTPEDKHGEFLGALLARHHQYHGPLTREQIEAYKERARLHAGLDPRPARVGRVASEPTVQHELVHS